MVSDWWEGTDDKEWDLFWSPDEDEESFGGKWPEQDRLPFEWEDWEE